MRLGLYGGSFDPIHRGHMAPVREAMAELALDRVVYLPTAHPPHKAGRELAPALARFAMVELALLDDPRCFVSAHELDERTSYTVETLEHFRRTQPDDELFLLLGADAFVELPSWRRWRDLPGLATLAVLQRPGWQGEPFERVLSSAGRRLLESRRAVVLANRPVEVIATELRSRLARGERPAGDVPEAVLEYISKYGLYR